MPFDGEVNYPAEKSAFEDSFKKDKNGEIQCSLTRRFFAEKTIFFKRQCNQRNSPISGILTLASLPKI